MKTYVNEHVTTTVEYNVHLLRQTWVGLPGSDEYQEGLITAMALAERHRVKRWLIDLRQLRMFNPVDVQWFAGEWLPEAALRLPRDPQIAVVLQTMNQFGKLGADLMLRAAMHQQNTLSSRYFLDDTEARFWLMGDLANR